MLHLQVTGHWQIEKLHSALHIPTLFQLCLSLLLVSIGDVLFLLREPFYYDAQKSTINCVRLLSLSALTLQQLSGMVPMDCCS